MTQLSILGPPRNGRKVLTEKEALEELHKSQLETKTSQVEPVVQSARSKKATRKKPDGISRPEDFPATVYDHPYFHDFGNFTVGGIEKKNGDFVFHDLKVPMGVWKELTLCHLKIPEVTKSFQEWAVQTRTSLPYGVTPVDITYGLMAACYLNKSDSKLKDLVEEIKTDIFYPNPSPHNATRIEYCANLPAVITPGVGWPVNHPFGIRYEADIAGFNNVLNWNGAINDSSVYFALQNLLGENDPDRCKEVLNWAFGVREAKLHRCTKDASGECVALIGNWDRIAQIRLDVTGDFPSQAYIIKADPKYHTKK